jgi:hypothetical protein
VNDDREPALSGYGAAVRPGGALLVYVTAASGASAGGVLSGRMAREMALTLLDMTGGRDIPPRPDVVP